MEYDKHDEGAFLQRYIIDEGQSSNLDGDGATGTSKQNGLRVKVWRISKQDTLRTQEARREIEVLTSVSDPALPVLADWLDGDSSIWLVVYDRPGKSLHDVIEANGPLPEEDLKAVITQLFSALAVLFYAGYSHLRICDQTLFLGEDQQLTIKGVRYCHEYGKERIGDLYAATIEKYGDDIYVAPEVFATNAYNARKATMWSCGVAVYYMATGQTGHLSNLDHPAFERKSSAPIDLPPPEPPRRFSLSGRKLSLTAQQAKIVTYPGTERYSLPSYVRDIISKLLISTPQKRPELIEVASKVPKEFATKAARPLMELAWLDYKIHVGPYANLDTGLANDSSASSIFSGVSNLSNPLAALLPGRRRSSAVENTDPTQRRRSSAKFRYA